jgi:hypothetical protein
MNSGTRAFRGGFVSGDVSGDGVVFCLFAKGWLKSVIAMRRKGKRQHHPR